MKKYYILLLCLFCFGNFLAAQDYKRLKVSFNYDSTTDYINFHDMAVDRNGNTYLAGYDIQQGDEYYQTHFYLVKINAAGTREWKRGFNTIKDSIDEAIAIAVDSAGYVYVTGRRLDTFCNVCTYNTKVSDMITMKYDSTGKRIWLNRYHDANYILAAPSDIKLSSNGLILITGSETHYVSQPGTYVSNLLIQKISKTGKTVWVKKMDSVTGNSGCFDKLDNIIIAGASNPDNLYQTRKPMVLKFNAAGNLLWSNIHNENHKNGELYFVQCDSAKNIYVNGQTDTLAFYNNPRIITIKYNTNGTQQWLKKETNHTTTMSHFYGDFKADASGNCYLTGFINKSSVDDDWLTVKYNNAGIKKWSKTFDDVYHGSDKPYGLAVDGKGNVFVSGYVYNTGGNYAIATVGYSKNGDSLFSDIYSKNKSNGFASGIGTDKNNNVYTGGTIGFYNNPYPAFAVIKYGIKQALPFAEISAPGIISELKLFPNPVINSMNINFTASLPLKSYNLIIRDVSGNAVLLKQLNSSEKVMNINVDASGLKPGVYTANISNGANSVSKTFIKE